MTLPEKSSYLKGLAEGLDLDKTKPEGKLIDELLNLVSDMAKAIADLEDYADDLGDFVDELDEDLADVEDIVYDDQEEDFECDGNCIDCDAEDCPDNTLRSAICPSCGEQVYFDESIDPDKIECPNCGKLLSANEEE